MSLTRDILLPVTTAGILYPALHQLVVQIANSESQDDQKQIAEYGVERITSNKGVVQCLICKKFFKGITNTHLEKHKLTLEQYKDVFKTSYLWNKNRTSWVKGLTKETDERVRKLSNNTQKTILRKYGVTNISKVPDIMEKMVETRRKTDNYGKGKKKEGTSKNLKDKKKTKEHCKNISKAVKLQYITNPRRREISKEAGSKTLSKIMVRKPFVSFPQERLFEIVKGIYPDAELEYRLQIYKNHNRFLDVAVPSQKLDFEYDGFVHAFLNTEEKDKERDLELSELGWKTIRIKKDDLANLNNILTGIPTNNSFSNIR